MNLVQLFADGGLVVVVAASFVMAVLWLVREKPLVSVVLPYVVMAWLTSLLAGKLMGFWQPEAVRPFVEQGVAAGAAYIDNPGFPSDHVLLAVVVVGVVYALTPYKKTALVLVGLILLMALARVAALVHTPLDIIGGALAGLIGLVWVYKYKRLYGIKQLTKKRK